MCRARPASKCRSRMTGETGGKETPSDLKVRGAVFRNRVLGRSNITECEVTVKDKQLNRSSLVSVE